MVSIFLLAQEDESCSEARMNAVGESSVDSGEVKVITRMNSESRSAIVDDSVDTSNTLFIFIGKGSCMSVHCIYWGFASKSEDDTCVLRIHQS